MNNHGYNNCLAVLRDSFQALLNLQALRIKYEAQLGMKPTMMPVFESMEFNKAELLKLMEFSELQYNSLQAAIAIHEKRLQPPGTELLDTIWLHLCGMNQAENNQASSSSGPSVSAPSAVIGSIEKLKKGMESWKQYAFKFTEATQNAIKENGVAYFPETDSVMTLLWIYKVIVSEVVTTNLQVLCSVMLTTEQEINKENVQVPKVAKLPFRAEDPVELPKVRFPPTRKQKCAPKYNNNTCRKY